jgi:hypothetical protein
MEQLLYSPDVAPADFYLLPRLKSALRLRRFCDAIGFIKNAKKELKRLSEKCFPRNVPDNFTVTVRSVQFHKGTIFREM